MLLKSSVKFFNPNFSKYGGLHTGKVRVTVKSIDVLQFPYLSATNYK